MGKRKHKPQLNNIQRETLRERATFARRRMTALGLIVREGSPIREAERMLRNEHLLFSRKELDARCEYLIEVLDGK